MTASALPPGIAAANDPASPPFGAFAPTPAQAAIIALAQRSRLKRGAFRPRLSRLVNLLRAGPVDVQYQGASFRFYHQASATERGALFDPDYNLEELEFLRAHTPAGGVFVDVGANVGTYAMALARHVGKSGKVIAIEPHPVTQAGSPSTAPPRASRRSILVAAAAGPSDGELMIETDGDNLGASHIVSGKRRGQRHPGAVAAAAAHSRRRRRRPCRCAEDRHRGFRGPGADAFFRDAPEGLWPRAIVIEHLSRNEWQDDCIADMRSRGYAEAGKTRSNTLLLRG